jgi:2-oxoglutarate ferredoxin oxidoreductase subunit gamma
MPNDTMTISEKYEIRLSGSGGQGVILAAVILGEAIVEIENRNAVQIQSYGPEARGGATKSDVVVSEGMIYYPKARSLDLLLALTQESFDNYSKDVKINGVIIADSDAVQNTVSDVDVISIPMVRAAKVDVGATMTTNIVALGAIQALTNVVKAKSLLTVIEKKVPKYTLAKNQQAFELGQKLIRDYLKKKN